MKIVNLAVATSESWNDKASGERKEQTEWHRVVIMNDRLGEVAEKYLRKGSKVYLEGKLQTRKWTDQSGQEKYTTEVMLGRFGGELVLLDPRRRRCRHGRRRRRICAPPGMPPPHRRPNPARARAVGGWDTRPGNDLDDEIPF